MDSKNSEVLKDFVKYCEEHPEQRFWQALRNWIHRPFVYVGDIDDRYWDTFYWEGKDNPRWESKDK